MADNSFEAKVRAIYNSSFSSCTLVMKFCIPTHCWEFVKKIKITIQFYFILKKKCDLNLVAQCLYHYVFVNDSECFVDFCRRELRVLGERGPTVTSSTHRANHSGMKRPRKRGEVTQEEPLIPMCIRLDLTASRNLQGDIRLDFLLYITCSLSLVNDFSFAQNIFELNLCCSVNSLTVHVMAWCRNVIVVTKVHKIWCAGNTESNGLLLEIRFT